MTDFVVSEQAISFEFKVSENVVIVWYELRKKLCIAWSDMCSIFSSVKAVSSWNLFMQNFEDFYLFH